MVVWEMPLTALTKLGFKVQAATSQCVLILLLSIVTPVRLLVMLMVLFLKPSVLFCFISEGGRIAERMYKECIRESSTDLLHCETSFRSCWFLFVCSKV